MKLGIVGTSFIVREVLDTIEQVDNLHLQPYAVFSRKQQTADAYKEEHRLQEAYSDYEAFLKSAVEAVYIATPNSLHYPQALLALKAKKHVLLEKPMALKPEEVAELFQVARENNVVIMEAMISLAKSTLHQLKSYISEKEVIMIDFHFAKQSRHYADYKAGKKINVFTKEFGGGAINDLGIYCLYPINYLFGSPDSLSSFQTLTADEADATTVAIGKIEKKLISITASKVALKKGASTIICSDCIIKIPNLAVFDQVLVEDYAGNLITEFRTDTLRMEDELLHFQELINSNNIESNLYSEAIAYAVCEQLQEINRN